MRMTNNVKKILNIDMDFIFLLLKSLIYDYNISIQEVPNPEVHLSIWYRVYDWKLILDEIKTFKILWIFGSNFNFIYTESIFIRILMSSGLIGLFFIIYAIRNVEVYILIFYLFAGAFLDLFTSIKVFLFTLILIYVYNSINFINKKYVNNK